MKKKSEIKEKWEKKTISEIGRVVTGKTPSRNNPECWGDFLNFITPTDMKNDTKFLSETNRFLSKDGKSLFSRLVIPANSVVVSCIGSDMGKVIMNKNECVTNQQINSIIINKDFDNNFIFYLLRNSYKILRINAEGVGSTMPIINKTSFENLSFRVPELSEQKEIASVLSSLDDKIELLKKQNETLEDIAKTIFKEWFIEFNFPNEKGQPYKSSGGKMVDSELGEIPEGWEVGVIDNLLTFEKGIEVGSRNYLEQKKDKDVVYFYRVQDISKYGDTPKIYVDKNLLKEKSFDESDILISLDGTIGRVFIGGKGGYSSGIRKVFDNNSIFSKPFIFFLLKSNLFQQNLVNFSGAETTIKHAGGSLKQINISFNENYIFNFSLLVDPIFNELVCNVRQIKSLEKIRDTLLPKLMKGETRVK